MEAVNKELAALRERGTWDEKAVMEKGAAMKLHPEAHFARLFPLVGIKNSECADVREHVYKGRIVLGGHDIKTASGDWAIFSDCGSTPSTMTAARASLAVAALLGLEVVQSDCLRAYVQAKLEGALTSIGLPRAWWPKSWESFKDPVCPLIYALYGHPTAGDCWGVHLSKILRRYGLQTIEGWPGLYYKTLVIKGKPTVIIVVTYVDDLIMIGCNQAPGLIEAIRKEIEMEQPHALDKYLGAIHRCKKEGPVTTMQWDMSNYLTSACVSFEKETGIKLKPATTPYASDLQKEALDKNLATPWEL